MGIRLDRLVVIDCDSAERVAWWRDLGFETDFVSRGRPERRNFWYRLPQECSPLGVHKLGDWEVRSGSGGFCVAPPSTHPDTHEPYEWVGGLAVDESTWNEIPPAPTGHLVDLIFEARRSIRSGTDGPRWSVVEVGDRDNFLAATGGLWRARGMGEDGIRAGLSVVNQALCQPPVTSDAIKRIAHSMAGYPTEIEMIIDDDDDGPQLMSRRSRYRAKR